MLHCEDGSNHVVNLPIAWIKGFGELIISACYTLEGRILFGHDTIKVS